MARADDYAREQRGEHPQNKVAQVDAYAHGAQKAERSGLDHYTDPRPARHGLEDREYHGEPWSVDHRPPGHGDRPGDIFPNGAEDEQVFSNGTADPAGTHWYGQLSGVAVDARDPHSEISPEEDRRREAPRVARSRR